MGFNGNGRCFCGWLEEYDMIVVSSWGRGWVRFMSMIERVKHFFGFFGFWTNRGMYDRDEEKLESMVDWLFDRGVGHQY